MIRRYNILAAICCQAILVLTLCGCGSKGANTSGDEESAMHLDKFRLVEISEENKVEVWIGDSLFTSYIYPESIAKPVLYPLKTESGRVLTRSYPLEMVPGERVDHPHHVGNWMNYGDVNGLDFWNNSEAIPEENRQHYGSISHKKVVRAEDGDESGILEVVSEWKGPDGVVLLEEHCRFDFSVQGSSRIIDRTTTLKALDQEVSFRDNKEGMFAVRVTRALELPSEQAAVFTDVHGNPTETKVLDNTGVNGNYLSSEGIEGMEVWGTRARWMELYSTIEGEDVALVIFDHPGNVGYPTYWHARGYGLFAANPLGQSVFTNGEQVLDFKLAPNETISFKYRLLVHSGDPLSVESLNEIADSFASSNN